jgi:hypothetical protein
MDLEESVREPWGGWARVILVRVEDSACKPLPV